jgi:hypothetical protein
MCSVGDFSTTLFSEMLVMAQQYFMDVSSVFVYAVRAWAAVWFAWSIVGLALSQPPDSKEALEQVMIFIGADFILQHPSMLWQLVDIILSASLYAASKTFPNGGTSPSSAGDLMCSGIQSFDNVFRPIILHSINNMSIFEIGTLLAIVLLLIPTLGLAYKMVRYSLLPLTKFFVAMILQPLAIFLLTVGPLRRIFLNGLKTMMAAGAELIVVFAAYGIIISMITRLSSKIPVNQDTMSATTSNWLMSGDYWSVLLATVILFVIFDEMMGYPAALLEVFGGSVQKVGGSLAGRVSGMLNGGK